ncbi:MAG TPA: O-antigen ligase family protein [Verrucomicrobiae bacterium]|nr:O-antigen ligase family protein [Verrucomicrobiae bacterium]
MNYVYIGLLVIAFVLIELLIGGTRLLFSLPSCGILALVSFLSLYSFRRAQVPANIYCLVTTALFSFYILLRLSLSPVEYLAREDLYILMGALMIYLFVALILTMPKYRFIFVMTLLFIALVHVTIGGIQYLRGERFPVFDFLQRTDPGLRASGLYICPNHLAGYLEVSALMGLSIVCWSRQSFWIKLLAGYGSAICAVGILLTASRGSYISTIIGLAVFMALSYIAIRRAGRHQLWVSAFGAIMVAAVLFGGVTAIFSRHYALQSRAQKIFDVRDIRTELWKLALKQYQLNPAVGTGGGTYQYYARLFRPAQIAQDPVYAHNDYLQLLAEYGVMGVALALGFVGCHFWFGCRALNYIVTERPIARYRMRSDALALNIGALSSLAIYVVHSFFDFNLHIPANAMLIAFVIGTLANPGVVMPRLNETHEKISHYLKLSLPALGLWIAACGLPTLPAEYFAEQARVALTEERHEDSVAMAELGMPGDRKNPYLFLYHGQALSNIGENAVAVTNLPLAEKSFQAAIVSFRDGLRLYPQEQWLLVGLASALDGLRRFDEAKPIYEEAIRWNPKSPQIHTYYATHLRLAGKFDEAEAMYKRSLQLFWSPSATLGLELLAKDRQAQASTTHSITP